MQLSIRISGDKDVQRRIAKLGNELHQLRTPMNTIGKTLAKYYSSTGFTDRGRAFNKQWESLSQGTLTQKEKKYPGAPALVRTGKMRNSFYYTASDSSVRIDNSMKYFKYHQSSRLPRKHLPRRPMMGINTGIRKSVAEIIRRDVVKKLEKAGA